MVHSFILLKHIHALPHLSKKDNPTEEWTEDISQKEARPINIEDASFSIIKEIKGDPRNIHQIGKKIFNPGIGDSVE